MTDLRHRSESGPYIIAALVALGLLSLLALLAGAATPLTVTPPESRFTIPADAVLIGAQPLSCDGAMTFYDTDKNLDDIEIIVVARYDEPAPRAVFTFEPGVGGAFLQGVVQRPGRPVEVFTTIEAVEEVYPEPCLILANGTV